MTKAIEQYANQIDYGANGWSNNRRGVKQALKKGLRTRCNRRRTSGRLLEYRTLGLYMDDDVNEASMERVVVATDAADVLAAGALAMNSDVGYRLKLKDRDHEMERALDMNGAAATIIAELLFLDPSEIWSSVRAAGAACLKAYVDTAKYPKFLRPESTEARKGVIRCMRDELKDLKAGDINLSYEEGD